MPSVLAIVSKSAFDQLVREHGAISLSTIVPLDRYLSKHRALSVMGPDDALFLVTVRPPGEQAWCLAVLENPSFDGEKWVAKANHAEVVDMTKTLSSLRFSTGKGIQAKHGALAMSLQTPRTLTADDVNLLRAASKAAPAADTPSAGPAPKPAVTGKGRSTKRAASPPAAEQSVVAAPLPATALGQLPSSGVRAVVTDRVKRLQTKKPWDIFKKLEGEEGEEKRLRAGWKQELKAFRADLGDGPPASTELFRKAEAFVEQGLPRGRRDIDEQAAFYCVATQWSGGDLPVSEDFLRRWAAAGDMTYVVDILERLTRMGVENIGDKRRRLVDADSPQGVSCFMFRQLEGVLQERGPAWQQVQRDALAERFPTLPVALRAGLAAAFRDPDWALSVALMDLTRFDEDALMPLLLIVRDGPAFRKIVSRLGHRLRYGRDRYIAPAVGALPAEDVSAALSEIISLGTEKGWGPGDLGAFVAMAACYSEPTIARHLAGLVHIKSYTPICSEYFERFPEQLGALQEAASRKGKQADQAKTLLASLSRKGAVSVAEPPITAAVADPSELPDVLVNPPWQQAAGVAPPPVAAVELPQLPEGFSGDNDIIRVSATPWTEAEAREQHPSLIGEASHTIVHLLGRAPHGYVLELLEKEGEQWELNPRYVESLAVRFGPPGLRAAVTIALRTPLDCLDFLYRTQSARLAPVMASFLDHSDRRQDALAWMRDNASVAIPGLIVAACKADQNCADALRDMAAMGYLAAVREWAERLGHDADAVVAAILARDPYQAFPGKLPKVPSWLNLSALPAPCLRNNGRSLPRPAVEALVDMLMFSSCTRPYCGFDDVRRVCSAESIDRFVEALVSDWMLAGAKAKDDWALYAVGFLGSEKLARWLDAQSREWPKDRSVALMQRALEAIAMTGTDVALSIVYGRWLRSKFEDTQTRARRILETMAAKRGTSYEDLEDDLVPELGLDEGDITLDFGSRRFRVRLNDSLALVVVDETGARMDKLPKPLKGDDKEKAKDAIARHKVLQTELGDAVKTQVLRLERAMRTMRTWTPESFRKLLAQPIVGLIAPRLVWSTGQCVFRVAEDGTLSDGQDAAWELPGDATVRLAHPLLDDMKAMSQVFADYELIQPFPQTAREVLAPDAQERDSSECIRVEGKKAPYVAVLAMLHGRGWRRTPPSDGTVRTLLHPLPERAMASLTITPGLYVGPVRGRPEQQLGKLVLTRRGGAVPTWGELPALLASELLRDLTGLLG